MGHAVEIKKTINYSEK